MKVSNHHTKPHSVFTTLEELKGKAHVTVVSKWSNPVAGPLPTEMQ